MLRANRHMLRKILRLERCASHIPPELEEIASAGFVAIDSCYLLRTMISKNATASLGRFPDLTGFECFVNSIHIDDYDGENHLLTALEFAHVLIDMWNKDAHAGTLRIIISSDETGSVLKCHLARSNESWLASDLEGYEEAVLVMDSTAPMAVSRQESHV